MNGNWPWLAIKLRCPVSLWKVFGVQHGYLSPTQLIHGSGTWVCSKCMMRNEVQPRARTEAAEPPLHPGSRSRRSPPGQSHSASDLDQGMWGWLSLVPPNPNIPLGLCCLYNVELCKSLYSIGKASLTVQLKAGYGEGNGGD
jgi:hypothetical protein